MSFKENMWKWLWSAAGVAFAGTTLLFAARYIIAQEVQKQTEPMKIEQQATSKAISDMKFEQRFKEVQLERDACLANHTQTYCDAQAEWRWEVYFKYVDCISGLEYQERQAKCGPEPKFVPPEN